MIEIENKIESIRNMKHDLKSIKLMSQKNADKMFKHLADFRNRICHEMSKIENNYQSGRNHENDTESRKLDQRQHQQQNPALNSDSDYNESQDSRQMSDLLIEWQNHSRISTDASTSLSNSPKDPQKNEKVSPSTDSLESTSTTGQVNMLFSKHLPYGTSDSLPIKKEEQSQVSSDDPSDPVRHRLIDETLQSENNPMTKDKIDKLTKKLKEIQTQNEELRNVNENIQNLLIKLSDLKYDAEDAETVDKLDAIKRNSQLSDIRPEIISETILKTENYEKCMRSVEIQNTTRSHMLTKINVAKLIIKRLRSCGNIAEQEHKYKVRVRQAERSITLKAHHNKPQ